MVSKKNLKLDCSKFGALEINRVVDSTYDNYQSSPLMRFQIEFEFILMVIHKYVQMMGRAVWDTL